MKLRIPALIAAGMLVASACGGSSAGCEAVADDAIGLVQGVIDQIDALAPQDFAAIGDTLLTEFEQAFVELERRAEDADCSEEQMQDLLDERVGNLTAASDLGRLLIAQFSSEDFGG